VGLMRVGRLVFEASSPDEGCVCRGRLLLLVVVGEGEGGLGAVAICVGLAGWIVGRPSFGRKFV